MEYMAFLLAVGLVGLVPVAGVAGLVIYNHREPPVTKPNVPQSTEQTRQVVQPTGKGPILSRQTGSPGPAGPPGQIKPYTGTGYTANKALIDTACVTYQNGNDDDTYAPKCYDFVYDHCIQGYQDPSKIPPSIVQNMPSVIKQVIQAADSNSFRNGVMPNQYSRVCVANAAAINAGHCPKDKVGYYRVHMPGYNLPGYRECDPRHGGTSFVKTHVDNNNKVFTQWIGNVGR